MKKAVFVLLLAGVTMLLSSCTVHFGNINIDLPWWLVTLLIVIPSLVIGFIVAWCGTSKNRKGIYICPRCGHRFKPGLRVIWSLHVMDDYSLKCPHCGKRDWCSLSYNQDE